MKFFKKFLQHSDYAAYIGESDKVLPNISYCKKEDEVHYTPWTETRIVANFNIEYEDSRIYGGMDYDGISVFDNFTKIEVDGVEISLTDLDEDYGTYQFSKGEHIIKYTLSDPLEIGDGAFNGCRDITSITIPNSVTTIGTESFYDCLGLTSITIPNNVTTINYKAFGECSSLTSITIPNSVTYIGNDAFISCTGLTSIMIPDSVTYIGEYTFCSCSSLTNITIGNSVTSINSGVFYDCTSLTSITIPNSVTFIGDMAFYGCSDLTSITIPNNVTFISNGAFDSCESLTSVNIPSSVNEIGEDAFYNCSSLTIVTVEATTPPFLSDNAFNNNASGRKIYVPSESVAAYKAASGWSDYASDIEAILNS